MNFHGTVTPNLVLTKSCLVWALIKYKFCLWELGLGFSIDKAIGGQLKARDHSRHYSTGSPHFPKLKGHPRYIC